MSALGVLPHQASLGWKFFRELLGVVWSTPGLRRAFVALLAIDLGWIVLFAVAKGLYNLDIYTDLYEIRALRITHDQSIPEWLTYVKTLLIVLGLGRLGWSSRQPVYAVLSFVFLLVLLDDSCQIHERVGRRLVKDLDLPALPGLRAQDIGEVITWAVLGAMVLPLVLVGFSRSSARTRGDGLALLCPFGLLVLCAIGVDQLYKGFSQSFTGAGILLDMVEDGGEMISLTTCLMLVLAMGHSPPAGLRTAG